MLFVEVRKCVNQKDFLGMALFGIRNLGWQTNKSNDLVES